MRARFDSESLSQVVSLVGRVPPTRTTMPIYEHLCLKFDYDGAYIEAVNGTVHVKARAEGRVEDSGGRTVSGREFRDFINSVSGEVQIYLDNESVVVRSEEARATFQSMPAEEYPYMGELQDGFPISTAALLDAIDRVAVAVDNPKDNRAPVLTGALLQFDGENLSAVGADGLRMARAIVPAPNAPQRSAIVPGWTLNLLVRALPDAGEQVFIGDSSAGEGLIFSTDGLVIATALIDGQYPAVERLIRKEHERTLTVACDDLHRAVARALIFCGKGVSMVRLEVAASSLIVSGSRGGSRGRSMIPCELGGEPISFAVNGSMLIDLLGTVRTEEICLGLADTMSPIVGFEVDGDELFRHIVMPMSLK